MRTGTHNCCPSHCCIDHGCKYGYDDCPVMLGQIKQEGFCENCGLETEGYYGRPERSVEEQEEYLEALWNEKHNPRQLTKFEEALLPLAREVGRRRLINILEAVRNLPFNEHKEGNDDTIRIEIVLDVLNDLKGVK